MQMSSGFFVSWWRAPMLRYRAVVCSRAFLAVVGGYCLAGACVALTARSLLALGLARGDATLAGTMLAFIVQALAALWVFGCATNRRAWLGVAVPAVVLGALLGWLKMGGVLP